MALGVPFKRIAVIVLTLALTACGTSPASNCDSSTCSGCCTSGGSCEAGTIDSQCGDHGFECVSCPNGQTCTGGVCVTTDACGGCASGQQCTRDMNGVVACRSLCTSNAQCSTGCCAATTGNYSVCAPATSCDPCGGCPSGQVCLSGQCVTNNACGGCSSDQRCISDQGGANSACRALCTTATQCSTGCCSTTTANYSVCGPEDWCCPSLIGASFQTHWQKPKIQGCATAELNSVVSIQLTSSTTAQLEGQYDCQVTARSACSFGLFCGVLMNTEIEITQSANGTVLNGTGSYNEDADYGTGAQCAAIPVTVTGVRQ